MGSHYQNDCRTHSVREGAEWEGRVRNGIIAWETRLRLSNQES